MKRCSYSLLAFLYLFLNLQTVSAQNWQTVGSAISTGATENTTLFFDGSVPYVAYRDNSGGNKATVKKFDGTTWQTVGTALFSAGEAGYITSAFAGSTPYVAYLDGANSSKATVMKFDGTNWVEVGAAGFSAGSAEFTSIAFSGTTPYVAYKDGGNGNKATVKKFNGTTWETVGIDGFSAGSIEVISLVFNGTTPYVVYRDVSNSNKATVMKFDGTTWVVVGSAGFSAGTVDYTSLAFLESTPYVVYKDRANSNKATVKRFNGTAWETVGIAGFSSGSTGSNEITFDGATPYVTFRDDFNGGKTTVMAFNGISWQNVGMPGFSTSASNYSFIRSNGGKLYVVYDDGQAFVKSYTLPLSPTISSFTPAGGTTNTSITISGTNFNATASNNIVYFGAVKAVVTSASSTSLTVTVPAGALLAPISVLNTANGLSGSSTKYYQPTFSPGKSTFSTGSLAALHDFSTGNFTFASAVGDLDGDGKPEMVGISSNNTATIFLNTSVPGIISAGSFSSAGTITTGVGVEDVVLGDFNGDGKLDIATTNVTDNTVSVFLNQSTGIGNITFAAKADFATGTRPVRLAVGDIDGDGLTDLVTANSTANTISLLRNISSGGSIAFATSIDYATQTQPQGVAIADLDNDGRVDIAAINYLSDNVSVFRNISSVGTFTASSLEAAQNFAVGGRPQSISIADIDLDGKMDIATTFWAGSGVVILPGATTGVGNISFGASVGRSAGSSTYWITAGDLTGDGKPEIVASDTFNIFEMTNNTSPGTFTNSELGTNVGFTRSGSPRVVIADMDGDGQSDIIASHGSLSVFRNIITGPPVITSFTPLSAAAGSTVTITGANFTGATAVSFGGTAATSFNIVSSSSITAVVAAGASGSVSVTTPEGTGAKSGFTGISADATLSALALSSGTLDPIFASGTITYTASVSSATSSITVTPTRNQANATIEVRVNGSTYTGVTSGSESGALALNVGSNTVDVRVTAQDGSTTKTYTTTINKPSADATLSALALSNGTLDPVFASGTITYTASVANATTSVTLTPTRTEGTATIKVNTVAVGSGSPSGAISLNVGANTITTEVTAGDGSTTKTYTITVTRAGSSNTNLSALITTAGALNPTFAAATTAYTISVPNSTSTTTITPTVDNAFAAVKVNGTAVPTGTASGSIALSVGSNTITAEVTAQDGTIKNYTVTITRAAALSSVATLSGITLSSGTLNTAFAAATTSYTATVPYASTSIAITPAVTQSNATVKVNGTTVSGTSSVTVPLNVGANTVTTIVTAQDGTTSNTYTIIVTRTAASTIANLSNLVISAGTLTPAFSAATTSYTMFVNNSVSATTVTPTLDNANATVKVNATTVRNQAASGSISLAVGVNTITVLVTAEDGISSKTYTVKITRLDPDQLLTDQSGNVTVSNTQKEVVITSPTQPVTVTIPAGTTTTPTVDYGNIVSGGTGTVPQTTINSPLAKVEIPASTTVSGSGSTWNGTISAPKISDYEFPKVKGQTITKGLVIEVGDQNVSLTFTKAVRLVLYGQAGMRIARVHGGVYEEITTVGTADTQAAGDALSANQSFKINVGADLVIWTKGFSQFITFSESVNLDEAVAAADLAELTAARIVGTNSSQNQIIAALTLPSTGTGGSAITWVSDKPAIVSNDGKVVSRPVFGSGNATVTLTGTITKGTATETVSFILLVLESPNQAPTLTAIANHVLCYTPAEQSIALSGVTAGPESGQTTTVSVASDKAAMFSVLSMSNGILNYTIAAGASGTATITVTVKDNGGTANGGSDTFTRSFTITVNPLPVIAFNSSLGTTISKGFTTAITASGGASYIWETAAGIISGQNTATLTVRPSVTTTYTVTATNATGCTSVKAFTLTVADDYKALDMNNIMTPNGDGKNDLFIIKNLDMYPSNTLKVFDRAGRIVYQKQNYTNDWNGTLNAAPLDEGTYFYMLDFGAGIGQLKGYISIVR